ncbi:MAG: asparagine--tRNA ligase [delta proteobacterium ML8_F1]|nr:MAG: asparagine--tRNA ligase [delta proteobacterium ML8_F1]
MEVLVKEIYRNGQSYFGQEISLRGWIRTNRSSKAFGFIELNDGSFYNNIQIVYEAGLENFEAVGKWGIASAISVEGTLVETPSAKQPFEVQAKTLRMLGEADKDYPLQKKRHTFEYLRTIAHLRPRSNTFSAVFRVRSLTAFAIHQFFNERGFVYIHTPIITGSDAEGAGEMFRVTTLNLKNPPLDESGEVDDTRDFFGKETNLTVSGQLAVEAFALSYRNVYTFGPTFRAENSNTARHAAEFWMIEPEMAFADLKENMRVAEELIKYIIGYVMDHAREELEFFNSRIDTGLLERLHQVAGSDFEHITYTRAVEILMAADKDFEYPVKWGTDLQSEHERYLTEEVYKKPVFVTDYPKEIKAFYMRMNDDGRTVAAMDLLVPGVGEIIGGSQREERYDELVTKIKTMGLKEEDYWWYLDLRKYGTAVHSGFGLGFERMVMYLTGMTNIRDVIPYPRTPKSAEF